MISPMASHIDANYVELPKLYESPDGSDEVLKLNKVTIWITASTTIMHLKAGLIAEGFVPSKMDPCLYSGHGTAVPTYVDDCIFFG